MIIRKYLNRFILVAGVLFFAACSSSEDDSGNLGLTLTQSVVGANERAQFVDVECGGEWKITIEYEAGATPWCNLAKESGKGSGKITLLYSVNSSEQERVATLRLWSGSRNVTAILTQRGTTGGGDGDGDGDGGDTEEPTPSTYWLELPSIATDANKKFVTHKVVLSGKSDRNFSMLFDTKEKIAYWVAYPMNAKYLGSQSRTDAFGPDPNFTSKQQMSSSINGYDRGHQIPSGDRTINYEANKQTFYYSNMTPQLGGFNQKIWVDLEGKVRGWTNACDTLYVVTGAILKTVDGNERVSYVNDRDGISIAIPNYYYKVLLQLNINKSNGQRSYKAIGFWFPHQNRSGSIAASDAFSVADIERKTGYNFFSNLPTEIQSQVEGTYAPREWGLN